MSDDFQLPLKVINLWGGPGSGKSTTAAGLFNIMKNLGLSVELVGEFAKDLTWKKDIESLDNQLFILAHQDDRLRRLSGKVTWAITDSPLPLSLAYITREYQEWLPETVWGAYERYRNYDFLLSRKKPYRTEGRNQTEHEALTLDINITQLFREAVDLEVYNGAGQLSDDAWMIDGSPDAPYVIADALGFLPKEGWLR